MHVTVVAATGGIGRHVVDQALAAGHTVTAAVRDPIKLHRRVAVAQVDLADPDPAALAAAVDGADAVVSCLGPRSSGDAGIVAAGTAVLIAAMRDSGCRRIVAVSGAGVSTVATPDRPDPPPREPGAGVFNRYLATPFARRLLGRHFVDVAMMESALRMSGLDWTAVRPPYLTDGPLTGRTARSPDETCGAACGSRARTSPISCSTCSGARPPSAWPSLPPTRGREVLVLDTMLWIAQGLLGVFFVAVGVPKVVGRGLDLWTGFDRLPRALVIVIGTCSIAGGIALVVPMLTGTLTWVTPLAAIGLSVLTLEASGFHVRGGEWLTAVETGIWAAIAAVIAAGRWGELASAPSVQVGILGPSLAVLLPTVLVILVLLTRRPVREARATQEPAAAAR